MSRWSRLDQWNAIFTSIYLVIFSARKIHENGLDDQHAWILKVKMQLSRLQLHVTAVSKNLKNTLHVQRREHSWSFPHCEQEKAHLLMLSIIRKWLSNESAITTAYYKEFNVRMEVKRNKFYGWRETYKQKITLRWPNTCGLATASAGAMLGPSLY